MLSSSSLQQSAESRSEEDSEHASEGSASSGRGEQASSSSTNNTPTRTPKTPSDKFDCAFRVALLGDAQSWKRQFVHSLVYGKYSKEASQQDSFMEQTTGYKLFFFFFFPDSFSVFRPQSELDVLQHGSRRSDQ